MAPTRLLMLACLLPGLAACASFTSPARMHELEPGKSYWLDYDASRRGTVVVATDGATRSCAEPSPDVALQMLADIKAKLDYQQVKAEGRGKVETTAVQLAERSQMLMFFREALYRVCEISLNTQLKDDQIVKLYEQIVKTALLLGSDKAIQAEVDMIRVALQLKAQEIEDKKLALEGAKKKEDYERLQAELQKLTQERDALIHQANLMSTQIQLQAQDAQQALDQAQQPAATSIAPGSGAAAPGSKP